MEAWIIFGLLGSLGYAIAVTIDRTFLGETKKNIEPFAYGTFAAGSSTLFLALLAFIVGIPAITKDAILFALAVGGVGAISSWTYYFSLQKAESSYVIPLLKTSVFFSVFLGWLFFNETITLPTIIGSTLIFLGSYLIIEKQTGKFIWLPKPSAGLFFVIASSFLLASRGVIDKLAVVSLSPMLMALLGNVARWGTTAAVGLTVKRKATAQFFGTIKKSRKVLAGLLLRGMAGAMAFTSLYYALQNGLLSRVIPLVNLDAVFAVLLGAFLLKEKETTKRLIGALIAIMGAVLLTI